LSDGVLYTGTIFEGDTNDNTKEIRKASKKGARGEGVSLMRCQRNEGMRL